MCAKRGFIYETRRVTSQGMLWCAQSKDGEEATDAFFCARVYGESVCVVCCKVQWQCAHRSTPTRHFSCAQKPGVHEKAHSCRELAIVKRLLQRKAYSRAFPQLVREQEKQGEFLRHVPSLTRRRRHSRSRNLSIFFWEARGSHSHI